MEKLSSTNLIPGAIKVGDCCLIVWLLSVNETVRVAKGRVGEFYQTEAELLAYARGLLGEALRRRQQGGRETG